MRSGGLKCRGGEGIDASGRAASAWRVSRERVWERAQRGCGAVRQYTAPSGPLLRGRGPNDRAARRDDQQKDAFRRGTRRSGGWRAQAVRALAAQRGPRSAADRSARRGARVAASAHCAACIQEQQAAARMAWRRTGAAKRALLLQLHTFGRRHRSRRPWVWSSRRQWQQAVGDNYYSRGARRAKCVF